MPENPSPPPPRLSAEVIALLRSEIRVERLCGDSRIAAAIELLLDWHEAATREE